MVDDWRDFNRKIVTEFRTNKGRVGGMFDGKPIALVTTTGHKSGKEYVTPLMYQEDGDRVVVFASKGGAPADPDWFRNILANPKVTVEVGTDKFDAEAIVASGDERERIWTKQKQDWPQFAGYEETANREIPVVVLQRV